MGAKGFGAGNFKALFESIESRHYEERYKTLIFLHYVKNITNHQHVILLIVKLYFSFKNVVLITFTRKMEVVSFRIDINFIVLVS
jgi:hypothetical protein